jgi:hypothetical protein
MSRLLTNFQELCAEELLKMPFVRDSLKTLSKRKKRKGPLEEDGHQRHPHSSLRILSRAPRWRSSSNVCEPADRTKLSRNALR